MSSSSKLEDFIVLNPFLFICFIGDDMTGTFLDLDIVDADIVEVVLLRLALGIVDADIEVVLLVALVILE